MATKADFNALEWQTVVEGPAIGGLIVLASQKGGTIRESMAMAKVYAEAKRERAGDDLLAEIVSQAPQVDAREFDSVEKLRTEGVERIRNAVALVESKGGAEDAEAYREFSIRVAERAAEADKSGGFLGIGGERVSDSERAALEQVASALGTTYSPPAAQG